MEKVIITEQDILNANESIPVTLKYAVAQYIAEFSTDKKQITIKEGGIDSIALPDMRQRNTMREAQFKAGVFAKEYMRKDVDFVKGTDNTPIPYLMSADEVDAWSSFETQLDRLKRSKDKAVADRCYDILNDYHAFCRMVSIEIEQELQIKNDIVGRFAWLAKSLINSSTPEKLQESIEELKQIQEQLETKEE